MHHRLIALAGLLALPVTMAGAQSADVRNVVSIQPLNAVFQAYAAEFERTAAKSVTWGLGGTYLGDGFFDDVSYTSAELKLRFYPAGTALHGFSIGGAVGFTSISDNLSGPDYDDAVSGPSFGVLLEYQWLMGEKKNFAFALGVGAKAINLGDEDEFASSRSITARYPTARVSFGFGF